MVLFVTGAAVLALIFARRPPEDGRTPTQNALPAAQHSSPDNYADPAICSSCHSEIARTYSQTGMGRSFSKVRSGDADVTTRGSVYHTASDRHYAMVERDGRLYQRRHQIDFGGRETNVLELEAHYVIGSGNHARTFVHRTASGRLVQLPVSWYAERVRLRAAAPSASARQGFWEMSPGYDRPAHLDFRRVIDAGCISCHNGYPRAPVEDDREGPRFGDSLPGGIDCQRCHGPGQRHIDAMARNDVDAARRAIVNPSTLDRDRQLDTCLQCHLESTSSPLPFQIRRAEHPPFSYTPGKPLSDYFIHFDHAPGSGHDDKFEIASGAYRLRKSACFQRSEMTCGTCHNPHDIPRGPKAVEHYVAVCESCHNAVHRGGAPRVRGVNADATCMDCHMPKRRAEDAVHVVMTDHYIQRRKPPRDLLADRTEAENAKRGDYRGEVVLYYPQKLPSTSDNELYQAVAQVQQRSNLTAGIRRLQQAIETHRPTRADFYYELGRAHSMAGDLDAAIRWCREALRRDSSFIPALKELASAATTKGELIEAAQALEKAVALRPEDANAFADLGSVYLRQGRLDDAQRILTRALALDPTMPLANNMMGLAALRKGMPDTAETHFREAVRMQPDLAEAHNNLGNVLAGRRAYPEATHHFEQAIRSDPKYVDAHHSLGVVLALTGAHVEAIAALRAAIALADRPQVRVDLADVLAAVGRVNEAAREYEIAAKATDPEVRAAAQAGLRGLGR
jgi:tetratricopeptide (TPR) repeat protein